MDEEKKEQPEDPGLRQSEKPLPSKDTKGQKTKAKWYHLRKRFIVGLLIFAGIVGYFWYLLPPTGSGPAGPSVDKKAFENVWRKGTVLLVGLGDSITTGFGAGGKKGRYGYFQRMIENPSDEYDDMKGICLKTVFPDLKVLNFAENATDSSCHLYVHLPMLETQPPDVFGVVVVTTGGIDLIHSYGKKPPQDGAIYGASYEEGVGYGKKFRERLDQLLDGIKEKFPGGCEIFLANIYDPTDGVGDIESVHPLLRLVQKMPPWPDGVKLLGVYNQHIKEASEKRDFVHLVDIHGAFMGHGTHCREKDRSTYRPEDPYYWYFFNLEDPNHRGYDAIRRLFLVKMAEVFTKK